MYFNQEDIIQMDRVRRLKLINSVSGIKSANLIGTKSKSGQTNLAIFSSVLHLGSDPALMGFVVRPAGEVPRHTYRNIVAAKEYTINHVHHSFIKNAHYTSAKFDKDISEFDVCGLTPEYIEGFRIPFVLESKLKLGMQWVETIPIPSNNTLMIVGEIKHMIIPAEAITTEDDIDLSIIDGVGISGLNTYYTLNKKERFPYVRLNEVPSFK